MISSEFFCNLKNFSCFQFFQLTKITLINVIDHHIIVHCNVLSRLFRKSIRLFIITIRTVKIKINRITFNFISIITSKPIHGSNSCFFSSQYRINFSMNGVV